MLKINMRFAKNEDLPSIVYIYNQAIRSKSATGDLTEFSVAERINWFNKFDKDKYPLYVVETEDKVIGYCSISPYREGRKAMESVAEISYYLDYSYHNRGIGFKLMEYVIEDCKRTGKENLLAILLDINKSSIALLEKFSFEKWGYLPDIINIDGKKCSHLIYGVKIK